MDRVVTEKWRPFFIFGHVQNRLPESTFYFFLLPAGEKNEFPRTPANFDGQ